MRPDTAFFGNFRSSSRRANSLAVELPIGMAGQARKRWRGDETFASRLGDFCDYQVMTRLPRFLTPLLAGCTVTLLQIVMVVALLGSGFSTAKFSFRGFLPVKSGRRERELRIAAEREETTLFFESPYRLLKTLQACCTIMPERQLCIARELTKKFEEFRRGTAAELFAHYQTHPAKGEIVLLVSGT